MKSPGQRLGTRVSAREELKHVRYENYRNSSKAGLIRYILQLKDDLSMAKAGERANANLLGYAREDLLRHAVKTKNPVVVRKALYDLHGLSTPERHFKWALTGHRGKLYKPFKGPFQDALEILIDEVLNCG